MDEVATADEPTNMLEMHRGRDVAGDPVRWLLQLSLSLNLEEGEKDGDFVQENSHDRACQRVGSEWIYYYYYYFLRLGAGGSGTGFGLRCNQAAPVGSLPASFAGILTDEPSRETGPSRV